MDTSTNDKTKLLIIEDNLICQAIYKANLLFLNFHIEMADTAHTGVQHAQNKRYDCIILDLGLPDLSGIEVLSIIRDSSLNKNTPVIVISSHVNANLTKQALQLGANAVHVKPLTAEELQQVIKETL